MSYTSYILLFVTLHTSQFINSQNPGKLALSVGTELSGYSIKYDVPAGPSGKEKLDMFYPRIGLQKGRFYLGIIGHTGRYTSTSQNLKQTVSGYGAGFRYYISTWKPKDSAVYLWKIKKLNDIPVFAELNYMRTNYDIQQSSFVITDNYKNYLWSLRLGVHLRLYRFVYLSTGVALLIADSWSKEPASRVGRTLGVELIF